jgi:hypothetical protein
MWSMIMHQMTALLSLFAHLLKGIPYLPAEVSFEKEKLGILFRCKELPQFFMIADPFVKQSAVRFPNLVDTFLSIPHIFLVLEHSIKVIKRSIPGFDEITLHVFVGALFCKEAYRILLIELQRIDQPHSTKLFKPFGTGLSTPFFKSATLCREVTSAKDEKTGNTNQDLHE